MLLPRPMSKLEPCSRRTWEITSRRAMLVTSTSHSHSHEPRSPLRLDDVPFGSRPATATACADSPASERGVRRASEALRRTKTRGARKLPPLPPTRAMFGLPSGLPWPSPPPKSALPFMGPCPWLRPPRVPGTLFGCDNLPEELARETILPEEPRRDTALPEESRRGDATR